LDSPTRGPFTKRSSAGLDGRRQSIVKVLLRALLSQVSVHAPNKAAVNSPVKSSAPTGPARSVLRVHDEPARGRWGDSKRIAPGSVPLLRDELAVVETKGQYPGEHLLSQNRNQHPPQTVTPVKEGCAAQARKNILVIAQPRPSPLKDDPRVLNTYYRRTSARRHIDYLGFKAATA
jgi:hypothetical protein